MSPNSNVRSHQSATDERGQSRYGVASTLDKYWEQKNSKDEALEAAKKEYLHINKLKSSLQEPEQSQ